MSLFVHRLLCRLGIHAPYWYTNISLFRVCGVCGKDLDQS